MRRVSRAKVHLAISLCPLICFWCCCFCCFFSAGGKRVPRRCPREDRSHNVKRTSAVARGDHGVDAWADGEMERWLEEEEEVVVREGQRMEEEQLLSSQGS